MMKNKHKSYDLDFIIALHLHNNFNIKESFEARVVEDCSDKNYTRVMRYHSLLNLPNKLK
jgi:hypothetical protein